MLHDFPAQHIWLADASKSTYIYIIIITIVWHKTLIRGKNSTILILTISGHMPKSLNGMSIWGTIRPQTLKRINRKCYIHDLLEWMEYFLSLGDVHSRTMWLRANSLRTHLTNTYIAKIWTLIWKLAVQCSINCIYT